MKYFISLILILSITSCNLFQRQQKVEEDILVKEPEWPLVEDLLDITEKKLLEAINDGRGEISDTTTFGKFFTIERIPRQVYQQALKHRSDLEQYVVSRVVYRSREVLFIDKQTGAEAEMGRNPLPTPDGKYVVDVNSNYFSIILTLYKVEKKRSFTFKKLITLEPYYWLLDYDKKEPEFFSNDGYLYMPTICRYFSEDIDKRTYVRIGIKNQSSVDNQ